MFVIKVVLEREYIAEGVGRLPEKL